jgi:hypothetical protein
VEIVGKDNLLELLGVFMPNATVRTILGGLNGKRLKVDTPPTINPARVSKEDIDYLTSIGDDELDLVIR